MGTNRGAFITLAQTIGNFTGSTLTLAQAFDDVIGNLGKLNMPPLLWSSGLAIATNTVGLFDHPAQAIEVLAVFHEGKQLHNVTKPEFESWDKAWRASTGEPQVVYTGEIDSDEIRMLPAPSTATTGAWIYSRRLTSQHEYTIPDYMALYVVFAMLEREYAYPSSKQDKEFSALCKKISQLFAKLIGL